MSPPLPISKSGLGKLNNTSIQHPKPITTLSAMKIEQGTLSLFGWQDHQLPDLPREHSHPEHRRLLEISLLCGIPNKISRISMVLGTRHPARSSKVIPTGADFNGFKWQLPFQVLVSDPDGASLPRFLGVPSFPWKSSHNSPRYRNSPDLSSFGHARALKA